MRETFFAIEYIKNEVGKGIRNGLLSLALQMPQITCKSSPTIYQVRESFILFVFHSFDFFCTSRCIENFSIDRAFIKLLELVDGSSFSRCTSPGLFLFYMPFDSFRSDKRHDSIRFVSFSLQQFRFDANFFVESIAQNQISNRNQCSQIDMYK